MFRFGGMAMFAPPMIPCPANGSSQFSFLRHLAVVLTLAFSFCGLNTASALIIANPSFETDSDWNINVTAGWMDASYVTSWSSDGLRSFQFYRGTGSVTAGNYASISQTGVDLTGVTGFLFDCRDTGIDTVPLQFLVDGNLVGTYSNNGWPGGSGSGWGHTADTYDIPINFGSSYTGAHTVTIQMYQDISHYPGDAKYYLVDNLRIVGVPEPSQGILMALGFSLLSACRRARVRFRQMA